MAGPLRVTRPMDKPPPGLALTRADTLKLHAGSAVLRRGYGSSLSPVDRSVATVPSWVSLLIL